MRLCAPLYGNDPRLNDLGTVCIGNNHENALNFYQDTVAVLDREAQR